MVTQLRVVLVTCLLLFILLEDTNSLWAKRRKYRKLAKRVTKLEQIMAEEFKCKPCSLIKNHTATVQRLEQEIEELKNPKTTAAPPTVPTTPGSCTAIGVAADKYYIPNSQMNASSVYLQYFAYNGRLNGQTGWCQKSQHITNVDYLQVDMGRVRRVCAVATQGKKNGSYVTSYKLAFSMDGVNWAIYQEQNVDKVFPANRDLNTIVQHSLNIATQARYVRFYPVTRSNFPCMRVEIFAY